MTSFTEEIELPYRPSGFEAPSFSKSEAIISNELLKNAETTVKYRGYIQREQAAVEKMLRLEDLKIPQNFDFMKVTSLSMESRLKLMKYRPQTIAQASRISGVSPADISVLLVYFGR